MSMNVLANNLSSVGQNTEAEALHRQVLEIRIRILGPEHPQTLQSMMNLASVLMKENKDTEAEKVLRQALEKERRVLGAQDPTRALSAYDLASIVAKRGQRSEAFSLLREALDHGLPPFAELFMAKDSDLTSLHKDPRFAALVVRAKDLAAASRKPL